MWVIGLTGDIGAGKSTAARFFSSCGASVIDADAVVRDLWRLPEMIEAARDRWGQAVVADGRIVPAEVARWAFSAEEEYRWLSGLLHRPVMIEMERRLAALSGWVVAEIPLLFEVGRPHWIDETVYVAASAEKRASRNCSRGLDGPSLKNRERWLLEGEKKRLMADFVVSNDGERGDLTTALEGLARDFADLGDLGRYGLFCHRALATVLVEQGLAAFPVLGPCGSGEEGELRFWGFGRLFRDVESLCRSQGVGRLHFSEVRRIAGSMARGALKELAR
ncbi:MAG: dephospho-CoA kinase [Synergistaceae bacterium]|nr:dephospho-CoA kinase [Synergistaceae bacterium]